MCFSRYLGAATLNIFINIFTIVLLLNGHMINEIKTTIQHFLDAPNALATTPGPTACVLHTYFVWIFNYSISLDEFYGQ